MVSIAVKPNKYNWENILRQKAKKKKRKENADRGSETFHRPDAWSPKQATWYIFHTGIAAL